jgi:tetratricopeptide (TPR) repeat protein
MRYPESSNGYAMKADAMFGLERFMEAASLYRIAIDKGIKRDLENVYRNLSAAYIRLKEYKKAYRVLAELTNPFNLKSGYKDIYELAMAAAAAGNTRDAVNFLKIAEMKLPMNDAEYGKKIKEGLLMLDPERE